MYVSRGRAPASAITKKSNDVLQYQRIRSIGKYGFWLSSRQIRSRTDVKISHHFEEGCVEQMHRVQTHVPYHSTSF